MRRKITFKIPHQHEFGPDFRASSGGMAGGSNACKWQDLRKCREVPEGPHVDLVVMNHRGKI